MTVSRLDSLREELKNLRCQHRDMDNNIKHLEQQVYVDSLEIRRLKKRKLQLKETIVHLEDQLIPDLNA